MNTACNRGVMIALRKKLFVMGVVTERLSSSEETHSLP